MAEDKRKYKPDGAEERCQCVMNHSTMVDGDIPQHWALRWKEGSNLYCQHCEELHGNALSRKTVTA